MNKGSLELLRSVDRVASRFPDVEYVIAGARHDSIDDRMLNGALGVNGTRKHVRLLGHVPWQQLADLYRRATVFVMPSFYETFGISVIEAMAFGLPVVATRTGGLPEVVDDGVTGILVSDVREMTRAIHASARLDRSACARRARERFSADRMAAEYERVFESMLRRRRSPVLLAEAISPRQSRLIG